MPALNPHVTYTLLLRRTLACVHPKRFRVHIKNVPVCTANTSACSNTRGRFECTHRGFFFQHTEEVFSVPHHTPRPHTQPLTTPITHTLKLKLHTGTHWNTTHAKTFCDVLMVTSCESEKKHRQRRVTTGHCCF